MRRIHILMSLMAAAAIPSAGDAVTGPSPRPPAVCFAPGTDPGYVAQVYAGLQGGADKQVVSLFQFSDGARWFRTATDGSGLVRGEPTTLTWSVVPDGLNIPAGFAGDGTGPSNLRARLNGIYGSQSIWQPIIQQALDEWATRVGTTYVFVNDDGAAWQTQGALGQRGDVRIAGRIIDGMPGGQSAILAYNFFPDIGDMVLDTADSFFDNTGSGSLRLRNVVSHEHGHGLGFDHVCPIQQTKLMEPFFSSAFIGPQHDDLLAGNRGYGDDREDNDVAFQGTDLGPLGNGTFTSNGNSIDGVGDLDFYRFTVTSGKQVDVTLTPIGSTYLQGPQQSNGNCTAGTSFNSLVQNDVALQVLGTNGITVLASANAQGPGGVETLNNVVLPSSGQFFIRVSGGTSDAVQLYNLSFTIENQAAADLAITKTDAQSTAVPGQQVTYTIIATNTKRAGRGERRDRRRHVPGGPHERELVLHHSGGSSCIVAPAWATSTAPSTRWPAVRHVPPRSAPSHPPPRHAGQHRHRRGARRLHRPLLRQQHRDRHRHADAAGGPGAHQDRRRGQRGARHPGHLHDHRHQPWTQHRHRRQRERHVPADAAGRDVDLRGLRGLGLRGACGRGQHRGRGDAGSRRQRDLHRHRHHRPVRHRTLEQREPGGARGAHGSEPRQQQRDRQRHADADGGPRSSRPTGRRPPSPGPTSPGRSPSRTPAPALPGWPR
jgi:hypothetical protein